MPYPLRALLKSPGFTLVAVLTIAVGIGANTTLYSVFNRLVLNPVSLPQPDSLVSIWSVNENLDFNAASVSWPRYELLRDRGSSFSAIGISAFDSFSLTENGEPLQLNGLRVSANFFGVLGVRPVLGRDFQPEDDVPNGPNVVLLSHELWETRFGGRASVVGETIQLNGLSWEVIGVLPPQLSNPFAATEVFAPRVFEVGGLTPEQIQNGAGYAQPIARLRPGVTLEQAAAELKVLSNAYAAEFPTRLDAETRSDPRFLVDSIAGNLRPTFYVLLGSVGFVLLIACANVASLFLSRLSARHREIAVRQSLGATRADLVRQFLLESLIFSVAAGALGVLLALWSLDAAASLLLNDQANVTLSLDLPVLLFTAAATLASALLIGLVPALQASRTDISATLKDAGRGTPGGVRGKRFRSVLVVVEVALSVVLLVGSALLLLSFLRLQQTPAGYRSDGVAAAFVAIPETRYTTDESRARFFADVIDKLEAVPQVKEAAAVVGLPLAGFSPMSPYSIAGRPILPLSQRPLAGLRIVSEQYFRLMAIPVRSGRAFTSRDCEGALGVCVINESFARRLFPDQSPIGQVLLRGRNADQQFEIVGVVGDVKSNGLNAPPPDEVYLPIRQFGRTGMFVVARTENGDAEALQSIIRSAVAAVDPHQPISFFQTMDSMVSQSVGVQRTVAALTALFAAVALALALVGLYSVLAYAVTQRTGEIGLRMALGAQRAQVVSLIIRSGLRLVAIGLLVGLGISAAAAHVIRTQLFGVKPLDPLVYGGVTILFLLVGTLACLLPSWRAARIDPLVTMRTE